MGCFAYCAQCAFDRLRAMRFGDFGIECAYGAIYAKSRVTAGAGCAGKNLAMLWFCPVVKCFFYLVVTVRCLVVWVLSPVVKCCTLR